MLYLDCCTFRPLFQDIYIFFNGKVQFNFNSLTYCSMNPDLVKLCCCDGYILKSELSVK